MDVRDILQADAQSSKPECAPFSTIFHSDVMLCLAAGLFSVAWFEVLKILGRPRPATALRK
jgi:hypothetical protein